MDIYLFCCWIIIMLFSILKLIRAHKNLQKTIENLKADTHN